MCSVRQPKSQTASQRFEEEIRRLRKQQTAAEQKASLVGMTIDASGEYREPHHQIKSLTGKTGVLDSEQGANHEQKETQEIAGHGEESLQARRSK